MLWLNNFRLFEGDTELLGFEKQPAAFLLRHQGELLKIAHFAKHSIKNNPES